jgi:Flp pilus assembly protein TadD
VALAALVLLGLGGCARFGLPQPSLPGMQETTLTERREARAAETVEAFERHRTDALMHSARGAFERDDLRACERQLRQIIRLRPHRPDARLLLADVLLATDRRAEAVKQVELTLRDHPDDPRAAHAMGLLLDAAGRQAEAVAYYRQAAQHAPANELYRTSYETACRTIASSDSPRAEVEQASHTGSVSADVESATGDDSVHVLSPPEPTEAPDASAGHGSIADRLLAEAGRDLARGDVTAATQRLGEATSANPDDPHIPLRASVLALQYNQPHLSTDLLRSAVVDFPQHAALHRALGAAHYRAGAFRKAEVALRQALSLDKADPLAYFLMGCTLAKLGQPDAARQQFARAAQLDTRFRNVRR